MINEIIISNTTDLLRLSSMDILCIEASGNYSVIVLTVGDKVQVTFQLGYLANLLKEQLGAAATTFIRVGRSAIINIEYLFSIDVPRQEITLRSEMGKTVTVKVPREPLLQLKEYFEKRAKKDNSNE